MLLQIKRIHLNQLSSCVQMIAAQKQLIENADSVQERIAQVQREGTVTVRGGGREAIVN